MQQLPALALTCLTAATTGLERICDADCEAVVTAAVEWSLARAPDAPRDQVFLNLGTVRGRADTDIAEPVSQRRVIEEVASKLGIVAADRDPLDMWRDCSDDPNSACALIDLRVLQFGPAPGMASICPLIWTRSWDRGAGRWAYDTYFRELRLLRSGEAWQFASAAVPRPQPPFSVPANQLTERACEEDCEELLAMAIERVVPDSTDTDLSRIFLDSGVGQQPGASVVRGAADLNDQVEVLTRLADRFGIGLIDREAIEGLRACREDWSSAECRAEVGISVVTVQGPGFGPDGTAVLQVDRTSIAGPWVTPWGEEMCGAACPFAVFGASLYYRPTDSGWVPREGAGLIIVN